MTCSVCGGMKMLHTIQIINNLGKFETNKIFNSIQSEFQIHTTTTRTTKILDLDELDTFSFFFEAFVAYIAELADKKIIYRYT